MRKIFPEWLHMHGASISNRCKDRKPTTPLKPSLEKDTPSPLEHSVYKEDTKTCHRHWHLRSTLIQKRMYVLHASRSTCFFMLHSLSFPLFCAHTSKIATNYMNALILRHHGPWVNNLISQPIFESKNMSGKLQCPKPPLEHADWMRSTFTNKFGGKRICSAWDAVETIYRLRMWNVISQGSHRRMGWW